MLNYYHRLITLMLLRTHNFSKANKIPTHLTLKEKINFVAPELSFLDGKSILDIGANV